MAPTLRDELRAIATELQAATERIEALLNPPAPDLTNPEVLRVRALLAAHAPGPIGHSIRCHVVGRDWMSKPIYDHGPDECAQKEK